METYIDGFVFPLKRDFIEQYRVVAIEVALIWKEYGALSYQEFIGDDLNLEGVKSFSTTLELADDEVVIFGWTVFPSKEVRDTACEKIPLDPRMDTLLAPIMKSDPVQFDARKMMYGGFKSFIKLD